MAGFMKRQDGHVYDGHHIAAEALENGVFVKIDNTNKVAKLVAGDATDAAKVVMRLENKYLMWGLYFLEMNVLTSTAENVWFTENEWAVDDTLEYNEPAYTLPAGKLVKMRQPVKGDMVYMSVEKTLYDALNVGDKLKPTTGGTVAKITQ